MNINHIQIGATNIVKAYLGNTIIYQKVMGLISLFSSGKQGFWYEPADLTTLYQDAAGTVPTNLAGDPIALVKDKSGNNNNAVQTVSTKRSIYNVNPSRITLDKVDDEFVVTVPTGGWIGTMVVASTTGTASYGVNIPAGTFKLGGQYFPSNNIVGALIRVGALVLEEQTTTEDYFVGKGAVKSFASVTNFSNFWRSRYEITNFPLVDTSNATTFNNTWYGCSNLTSFPTINTAKATSFSWAWQSCSGLTSFPAIDTSRAISLSLTWDGCYNLTSFPVLDTSAVTSMYSTWSGCSKLTSFPLLDTSKVTNMSITWYYCAGLTTFPLLDTTNVTHMNRAWSGCSKLTSFPLLNTARVTDIDQAWANCSKLTAFPLINTSAVTNFQYAWFGCSGLTTFPAVNTISGTNFSNTWNGCTTLADFPANVFNNIKGGNFTDAFTNTALTQVSIDNILTSLVTSGIAAGTRVFKQSGGSAPSIIGTAAIGTLRARGWTVTVTGGY